MFGNYRLCMNLWCHLCSSHSNWCSTVNSYMYIFEPFQSPIIPVLITSDSARAAANAAISHYLQFFNIYKKLVERRFKSSVMLLEVSWLIVTDVPRKYS